VAEAYDLFLVDQWGVLHDGRTAFPEAADCLRRLLAAGKRVAILSNSGRSAKVNAGRLEAMGLGPDCYTLLLTSGELARELLERRTGPFPPERGDRCLLLGGDGESGLLKGLDVAPAASAADADFVLLAGVGEDLSLEDYDRVLAPALSRGLPLVCINPDLVRFSSRGFTFSAGEIAARYQRAGGHVDYVGKPDPLIYQHCLGRLPGAARERSLAVGDSLHHDVAGGARAGLATAFVVEGIHRPEFAGLAGDADRLERLAGLAERYGAAPDWMIERFRW
jgi:HAD superfamily hydrolase (TIGR01459 family)